MSLLIRDSDDRKPADFGLDFPDWYPHQFQAAKQVASGSKPFVLLNGPTGCGKSLLAMAASKLMGKGRTIITVRTKQLQTQYFADFPEVAIIWGRGNYQCALYPEFTVDEAPCNLEGLGCSPEEKWVVCEYHQAKRMAQLSPIVVTNIAYALAEMNYVGQFSNVDFLVFDEGHLLEDSLMRFAGVELSRRSFSKSELWLPDFSDTYAVRAWARQTLPLVKRRALEARERAKRNQLFLREAIRLNSHCKYLNKLSNIEPTNWVLRETMFGYEVQPLWASDFGWELAFRHGKKILIMSATLLSGEIYARQLGINEPFDYIDLPSIFPVENRPINYWPVAKLRGHRLDDHTLNLISNAIDLILQAHKNQKGIVHTVSYKLRDAILQRTRFRDRFISHNLGDEVINRSEALESFLNTKEPKVIISPSMGVGVDLPDDKCLLPGTLIKTPSGYQRIEEIKPGDSIMTHKGVWAKVQGVGVREYDGKVIQIEPWGMLPIVLTPEHPIAFAGVPRLDLKNPRFKSADEVTEKDFLCFPRLKPTGGYKQPSSESRLWKHSGDKHWKRKTRLRQRFFDSHDFWRLAGLYAADGNVELQNGTIHISCHAEDSEMIREARRLLEVNSGGKAWAYREPNKNATRVSCKSLALANWLAYNVGTSSRSKRVPYQLSTAKGKRFIPSFISCYLMGDGCITRSEFNFASVSPSLALGLRDLLLDCAPRIRYRKKLDAFEVTYRNGLTRKPSGRKIGKHYLLVKPRRIQNKIYKGPVFNLAVSRHGSYTTSSFAVHNCRFNVLVKLPFKSLGDPQVRARMEKDPDWYSWDCAAAIIQSTGRSTRSVSDYSTSYVLDAQATWFFKRNSRLFPSWWREAVHQISDISEAVRPPQDRWNQEV